MPDVNDMTRKELEWFYRRYKDIAEDGLPTNTREIFDVIKEELEEKETLSKSSLCKIFKVTRQGYNHWLKRGAQVHGNYNDDLLKQISHIFYKKRRVYGYVRITKELERNGIKVNDKTVLRYM